ncbi:C6 transcription factor, partial [Seiridium cupressi]
YEPPYTGPSSSADHTQGASGVAEPNTLGASPARLSDHSSESDLATGSFGKLHFAGHYLGEISSYNGVPLFSKEGRRWIQTRTGQLAAFPRLEMPLWHNQLHIHNSIVSPASNFELPDRRVIEEYFSVFSMTPIRFVFPIVDSVLFRDTVAAAYEPGGKLPSPDHATAKACVFSFLSIVSLMETSLEATPIDSDACALKAQYLLPQVLVVASVDALQVALMQCMFNLFSGRFQTAAMFHSVACRMLFMLSAHTQVCDSLSEPPIGETDDTWRVKCHLRKYFWMCYSFDKDIALRSGQPPCISDEHCDLTLPRTYSDPSHEAHVDTNGNPFLPGDLRLAKIKSKALRLLFSTQALQKSDAVLLRDIRELDDELEAWRLTLNPKTRPSLSRHADGCLVDPNVSTEQRMHYIITNFEYHHLMAAIGAKEKANRDLFCSIKPPAGAVRGAIVRVVSWRAMIIFYPMSAVLTIFCNILLNPGTSRAPDDLELLRTAPELIKGIRIPRLTLDEVMHIKKIEDFMAEVIRLGLCAIQKARHDQHSQHQMSRIQD